MPLETRSYRHWNCCTIIGLPLASTDKHTFAHLHTQLQMHTRTHTCICTHIHMRMQVNTWQAFSRCLLHHAHSLSTEGSAKGISKRPWTSWQALQYFCGAVSHNHCAIGTLHSSAFLRQLLNNHLACLMPQNIKSTKVRVGEKEIHLGKTHFCIVMHELRI